MRKVLMLTISSLAICGFASAQLAQKAEIEQIGLNNSATIDQDDGKRGLAKISQTGDDNTATVEQVDTSGSGSFSEATNDAEITQTGIGALATVVQIGNEATGPRNQAFIIQNSSGGVQSGTGVPSGRPLDATALQSGSANVTNIMQSVANVGSGFVAYSDQTGTQNTSLIEQFDSGHDVSPYSDAHIMQNGNSNVSRAYQQGAGALATLVQNGDDNFARTQQGPSEDQIAIVTQNINNSTSLVFQQAPETVATVLQDGLELVYSDVWQRVGARASVANVEQYGSHQFSHVVQNAEDSYAQVQQSSMNNSSVVKQESGANHSASVLQTGTSAWSEIMQFDELHIATVTQTGDHNRSEINQDGGGLVASTGNLATVLQDGDGTFSFIDQSGDSNLADVMQTVARNSVSNIVQSGSSHTAYVSQ